MNRLTIEERKRANKIRCKLLYTIDRDIRETKKKKPKTIFNKFNDTSRNRRKISSFFKL